MNQLNSLARDKLLQLHHEIRTPLNVVLGFIQILSHDTKLSKSEKKRYLKIITSKSDEILRNIDVILGGIE